MVEKINKLPKCSENVTNFAYAFYMFLNTGDTAMPNIYHDIYHRYNVRTTHYPVMTHAD